MLFWKWLQSWPVKKVMPISRMKSSISQGTIFLSNKWKRFKIIMMLLYSMQLLRLLHGYINILVSSSSALCNINQISKAKRFKETSTNQPISCILQLILAKKNPYLKKPVYNKAVLKSPHNYVLVKNILQ